MYFFWQKSFGDKWEVALATERANIIREKSPELVTILDVSSAFEFELTPEEINQLRYKGPFYLDFDDEDLEYLIPQFQSFLKEIQDGGYNLDMARLYATGGRGFHIEFPPETFLTKKDYGGIINYPAILREFAYSFYVDGMDLRVYSAKKGRMWRLPNVKRDNGKCKVQITTDEAFAMTPQMYEELCSGPRDPVIPDPPVYNAWLSMKYSSAADKVSAFQKRVKKSKAPSLARFNGQWPKALKKVIETGEGVLDNVGWNNVAMQLCLTAQALGRTREQTLEDLKPLVESYVGDSSRYGNRYKRMRHVADLWDYLTDNPGYDFDMSGLRGVLENNVNVTSIECEGFGEDDDEFAEYLTDEDNQPLPVRIGANGIWHAVDGSWKRASCLGITNPYRLVDENNNDAGYEVDITVEGVKKGTKILPVNVLASKAQLHGYALTWSTAVNLSDSQAGALADVLRRRTEKEKRITYVTQREGLDYVVIPGSKDEKEMAMIWVSPEKVIAPPDLHFRLRSSFDKSGVYRSDLMNAPELTDTPHMRKLMLSLLSVNTPQNVARIFGWFMACFLCQPIRHVNHKKFPMLQVYGEAGAGKSHTVLFFNHLHYFLQSPKEMMSVGGTTYPAIAACASSASMPVVFEEMKPSEMSKSRKDFLVSLFRSCYDGHGNERGGLSKDNGSKEVVISTNELKGPVVFCGESLEDQTAIVERCVIVALAKYHRHGRTDAHNYVQDHVTDLGIFGKWFASNALAMDIGDIRESFRENQKQVLDKLRGMSEDAARPATALAITLLGLEFAQHCLSFIFGDCFDEKFEELRDAVLDNVTSLMPSNKSEVAKVLDVMAQLTRIQVPMYMLERGNDYVVNGERTELNLKQCFYKYTLYERSMGKEPLFSSESKFISAMTNFAGTETRACPGSEIFKSPRQVVFSINNAYLDKVENEQFEP